MARILLLSHGHPELSKGGAEVASWNVKQGVEKQGHDCLYVSRADGAAHGGSTFSLRNDKEILFHTQTRDWFSLGADNTKHLFTDFYNLVVRFQPDVIHVHHYAHMGIELFMALRRAVPKAKIVFTLHEFMAICMHNGQMVKTGSLKLCYKSSPFDCHKCFPKYSPADFFLRKSYLQDQLSYTDAFISPSGFLAERYIDWGLPMAKMHVIENVLPAISKLPPRPLTSSDSKRTRLAFFGQINPYKGLDVLLEALLHIPDEIRQTLSLNVHGANLDVQTDDLKAKITQLLEKLGGIVAMRGPYESEQLQTLMAECDWVVMPSIWWENSPVVIQEAIAYGRPLIGSSIGGMREKIEGIAGLTFDARNPVSLAAAITSAIEPECFDYWYSKLESQSSLEQHVQLIDALTGESGEATIA